MQTTNIVDENIKRIGEMFPNCLTERLDENGRPEVAIDFDQLRQELSKDIVEGPEERYQFTWPDKRNAIRLANAPTTDTLRPCREESVDFDNTQNLYIEGDNLQVLKLLRENYLGKVKMIYIDPPYNTGNDFVYDDDFSQTGEEFLHNSGQLDNLGNRLVTNSDSNGRFHTDWLNMILPRLKVSRDLLSSDGVIFISIDNNEIDNMKKVCDEIFGPSHFLSCFAWVNSLKDEIDDDTRFAGSNLGTLKKAHEYVLVYGKEDYHYPLDLPSSKYIEKPTPVGNYAPDGAIAFNDNVGVKHIYFIAETKGSMDSMQLKGVEKAKIECAKKLFNNISTSKVRYSEVSSYQDMLDVISGLS